MLEAATLVLIFGILAYLHGKYLIEKGFYFDLVWVIVFTSVAFYYGLAYALGWEAYNPLDTMIYIIEPISEYILVDLLGI